MVGSSTLRTRYRRKVICQLLDFVQPLNGTFFPIYVQEAIYRMNEQLSTMWLIAWSGFPHSSCAL